MEKKIEAVLIVLLAIETFFIALALYGLNDRINELEKKNNEVHEYILNRIGG